MTYPPQPPGQQPYPQQPYQQPYGQSPPSGPLPSQPYQGQPYPGQPAPGQPAPSQPMPGQPYPPPYPGQARAQGTPGPGSAIGTAIAGVITIGVTIFAIVSLVNAVTGICGVACFGGMISVEVFGIPVGDLVLAVGIVLLFVRVPIAPVLTAIGSGIILLILLATVVIGFVKGASFSYLLEPIGVIRLLSAIATVVLSLLPPTRRYASSKPKPGGAGTNQPSFAGPQPPYGQALPNQIAPNQPPPGYPPAQPPGYPPQQPY